MTNDISNLYFYTFQFEAIASDGDSTTVLVSGLVNTPIMNPLKADPLKMAIEADIKEQGYDCLEVKDGRLLTVTRL